MLLRRILASFMLGSAYLVQVVPCVFLGPLIATESLARPCFKS
uniref:Uncharacterized protein n=1 Tax=Anguilla anguilla TaxID=7936 RepID=A0A0E9PPP1_ANGAN